jgi:MoaA/NifB/PqqE/SkfB family radical SAM enzyme
MVVSDLPPPALASLSRFDHTRYVSMTMEFRCNLRCQHCMIEDTMDRLAPQSEAQLQALFAHNAAHRQWSGLILTGSEITLHRDLARWARQARQSGFEHVRIQTHGMRLADRDYCERLVDAGVDEFFISVCAADAEVHDRITQVPGSFVKTFAGLENLERLPGVCAITNTVVTAQSYRHLPAIVDRLGDFERLVQFEFWGYFPMRERDDKNLLVAHPEVLPWLRQAIEKCRSRGRGVEVKNFPECLLGDLRRALYNDQPQLFIDPAFWTEFARNGFHDCVYRQRCSATQCLGLNAAYSLRFGQHADLLRPFARAAGG